jgi:hypothetical protein
MAGGAYRYLTLMASLPALQAPFVARQLPLSRLRLEARLRLLDEDDAGMLSRILDVMQWERAGIEMTDADMVLRLDALMDELHGATLRRVISERFALRTVLAAMRRRRRGQNAPATGAAWGFGEFVDLIRRNWTRPHFGLRRTMPWLAELRELHDAGATLELERAIVRVDWDNLCRAAREHEFDFEAVVLYALRYNVVADWLGHAPADARARFEELVASAIGDNGTIGLESA